jgi:hypothetical protein
MIEDLRTIVIIGLVSKSFKKAGFQKEKMPDSTAVYVFQAEASAGDEK